MGIGSTCRAMLREPKEHGKQNLSGTSEAPDRHTKSQEHPRPYQYPDSSRGAVTQGSVQASEVPSRGCELGEALGLLFQELLGLSQLSEVSSWSDFQSTDPAHQTLGLDLASDIHQDPFQMSVSYVNRHQYSFTLMTFPCILRMPHPQPQSSKRRCTRALGKPVQPH